MTIGRDGHGIELIPADWQLIYNNPLRTGEDVSRFRMEGDGEVSFPMGRMRLESTRDPGEGQAANLVFWCQEQFPADVAVTWEFQPIRGGRGWLSYSFAHKGRKDLICSIRD
jgi:hypothetical protein